MSSLSLPKAAPTLPILSLTSSTLPHELYRACADHGFFYLVDHGIPISTLSNVIDLARRFFLEVSDEEKDQLKRREGDGARGYQKVGENVTKGARDWHEAVDFYRERNHDPSNGVVNGHINGDSHCGNDAQKIFDEMDDGTLQGPNLWPNHPKELKAVYEDYIESVKEVGTKVVRAMGEALGLEGEEKDTFVNATRKSFWVMRMIGYPPLESSDIAEKGVSCGEHTDYGCVTLLLSDATPNALQVQLKDGTWITANPIPGAFVVNIGDMIERWTNGEWKSTNHRVIHRAENFRVSVPFFFEPDFDAVVRPLQKCVERAGGKERYGSVKYGQHLLGKIRGNFY